MFLLLIGLPTVAETVVSLYRNKNELNVLFLNKYVCIFSAYCTIDHLGNIPRHYDVGNQTLSGMSDITQFLIIYCSD